MANDFTRMQKLAGIIKENQHKEMDESKMDGNPVKKLVNLLNQTITIADENIPNAHNFDLEDFSQTLEGYVDELTSIGKFETYDEKMDEVKHEEDESKMDEAEDTLSSFKSLDQMNDYLEKDGWDPYEVEDEQAEKKGLMLINKYIKSNILDKGKTLSPNKLNALLMKIEDLLP